MELELLKMMADNGTPLVLRTESRDEQLWVSRDGAEPVKFSSHRGGADGLRAALAHYPREVTIDGDILPVTPAPTAARVTVLEPGGHNIEGISPQDFLPGEDPGNKPLGRRGNAIIGGVLCYINSRPSDREKGNGTYLSRFGGQESPRYRMLQGVRIEPHTEIEADEISQMVKQTAYDAGIREGSPLHERVMERRLRMIERTEALPGMPERYRGDVHFWPLTGQGGDRNFYRGAPVEVTGRPVAIDQDGTDITDPELLSVADALDWSRSDMVLVTGAGSTVMNIDFKAAPVSLRITGVKAEAEPEGKSPTPAERITMHITLEDTKTGTSGEITLRARMHLWGEYEDELESRVVQGAIDHGELQDILVRAVWTHDEECGWDELKYQHEMMTERMGHLATCLLGDPEGAMLAEMQKRVDRIFPNVPVPARDLSVTSQDGRWTLTLNEAARSQAA